jgi:hypothetical protein
MVHAAVIPTLLQAGRTTGLLVISIAELEQVNSLIDARLI